MTCHRVSNAWRHCARAAVLSPHKRIRRLRLERSYVVLGKREGCEPKNDEQYFECASHCSAHLNVGPRSDDDLADQYANASLCRPPGSGARLAEIAAKLLRRWAELCSLKWQVVCIDLTPEPYCEYAPLGFPRLFLLRINCDAEASQWLTQDTRVKVKSVPDIAGATSHLSPQIIAAGERTCLNSNRAILARPCRSGWI